MAFSSSGQEQIELLLRIIADTTGAQQASQAFQQLAKQGDRLGGNLTRAFSPRITQNMGQVRSQLLGQGKALEELSAHLTANHPKLSATAQRMLAIGVAQEKMAVTGKVNTKELESQGAGLSRLSVQVAKYTEQLRAELAINEASLAAQRQVNVGRGKAAKANQADMLKGMEMESARLQENIRLSEQYSSGLAKASGQQGVLAQQAKKAAQSMGAMGGEATMAGKAGQGLVLSFSMAQLAAGNFEAGLFGLGFSLLFVGRAMLGWPIIIATAVTALTVGVPMLVRWAKGLGDVETQQERVSKMMEEFRARIDEAKGSIREFAEQQQQLADSAEPVLAAIAASISDKTHQDNANGLADALGNIASEAFNAAKGMFNFTGSMDDEAAKAMAAATRESTQAIEDQLAVLYTRRSLLRNQEAALRNEIRAENQRAIILRNINAGYDAAADRIRDYYDALTEGARESGRVQADAIQKQLQQTLRALEKQQRTERDTTKDFYEDQIEAAKDAADAQVEASKDKVDQLKEQERALVDEYNRLQSERLRAIDDIKTTEAEIAAIKALIRKFGPDEDLQAELAIREARLKALQEESESLKDQIDQNKEKQDTIEDQIESEDKLQDTIRDNYEEQKKLIEDTRDAAMQAIDDRYQAEEDRAREAADAQIDNVRRATDAAIDGLNRERDAAIEVNDKMREQATSMLETNSRAQQLQDILEKQRNVTAEITLMNELMTKSLTERVRILEAITTAQQGIQQLINVGTSPEAIRDLITRFLRGQGISDDIIKMILAQAGIPSFQYGGTVPGPMGAPKLIVAHGGEKVSSAGAGNVTINIDHVDVNKPSDLAKLTSAINRSLGRETALSLRSRRFGGR